MKNDAEKNGAVLAAKNDDRITKVGGFLRKTRLDEIPQLLNIIAGDMSIVGPRPRMVQECVFLDETQMDRFKVRPGITGWAQVNGRNNITFDKVVQFDKEYVEKLSFGFDFKIFFKTIGYIFGKGKKDINKEGTVSNEFHGDYLLRTGQIEKEYYDEKIAFAKEKIAEAKKSRNVSL